MRGSCLFNVIDEYVGTVNAPQRAIDLFHDDWKLLLTLSGRLGSVPGDLPLARQARRRALELLQNCVDRPDATVAEIRQIAYLYFESHDYAEADRYLARAIPMDYADVGMHVTQAQALLQLHRLREAQDEARTALRLDPQNQQAKGLLKQFQTSRQQ